MISSREEQLERLLKKEKSAKVDDNALIGKQIQDFIPELAIYEKLKKQESAQDEEAVLLKDLLFYFGEVMEKKLNSLVEKTDWMSSITNESQKDLYVIHLLRLFHKTFYKRSVVV